MFQKFLKILLLKVETKKHTPINVKIRVLGENHKILLLFSDYDIIGTRGEQIEKYKDIRKRKKYLGKISQWTKPTHSNTPYHVET